MPERLHGLLQLAGEIMAALGASEETWQSCTAQAALAAKSGNLPLAEHLWTEAAEEAAALDPNSVRLPMCLEALAEVYWRQGKLRQAENVARKAFDLYEKILPAGHSDIGEAATNLAMIYHWQQKYGQAEALYLKAIEIKSKLHGPEHREVATVLTHYAKLLQDTHREEEAAHLTGCLELVSTGKWKKTQTLKDASPPEESSVPFAFAPGSISSFARSAETEAPPLPQRGPQGVLQAQHNYLSTSHSNIPTAASNPASVDSPIPAPKPNPSSGLGSIPIASQSAAASKGASQNSSSQEVELLRKTVHEQQQKISQLEQQVRQLMQEVLKASASALSATSPANPLQSSQQPAHAPNSTPAIATTIRSPEEAWAAASTDGQALSQKGQWEEAQKHWFDALQIAEHFEARDPRFAATLDSLGECLFHLEKYGQAEMIWQRALQIKRETLGTHHAQVAQTADCLARLHFNLSRFQECEFLANKCIEIYTAVNGADSLELATGLHNLAIVLHVQGKYAEAEPHYSQALKIRKSKLPKSDPAVTRLTKHYADLLKITGRNQEAEQLTDAATGLVTGNWTVIEIRKEDQLQG